MALPLFEIDSMVECRIVKRLNRFVVLVERNGLEKAHTNNTSSLRGLLVNGRKAYCIPRQQGKTSYRLVAISCPGFEEAALIDTALQMKGFETSIAKNYLPWLRGCMVSKRNPRVGKSLLDYLLVCNGVKVYVEIKSATLRLPGERAAYPEPASMRGRRHVRELAGLAEKGEKALLVFIVGIPGVRAFTLNREADPLLPSLLMEAVRKGVVVKSIQILFLPRYSQVVLSNTDLPVEIP